jgi:hypothetical protein
MENDERSKRKRERLNLSLPVQVYCRESEHFDWKEITRLTDVTPFGAGITLAHLTEVGRLLQLTMNLPRQLRCYDHIEPQYKVWCLIRHVRPVEQEGNNPPRYVVGVAFVGKHPPESYQLDPSKRYDISESPTATGMWNLIEMKSQPESRDHLKEKPRPETRYMIQINVRVEVIDDAGNAILTEETVTENISHHGAAIFTTLNVEKGRFVRLTSLQQNISAMSVVRGRRTGKDGIPRIHLQFIDSTWPIEGLD